MTGVRRGLGFVVAAAFVAPAMTACSSAARESQGWPTESAIIHVQAGPCAGPSGHASRTAKVKVLLRGPDPWHADLVYPWRMAFHVRPGRYLVHQADGTESPVVARANSVVDASTTSTCG